MSSTPQMDAWGAQWHVMRLLGNERERVENLLSKRADDRARVAAINSAMAGQVWAHDEETEL